MTKEITYENQDDECVACAHSRNCHYKDGKPFRCEGVHMTPGPDGDGHETGPCECTTFVEKDSKERWIFVVHVTPDEPEVAIRNADREREIIRVRLAESIENFNVVQDIDVVARVVHGDDVVDVIFPKEPTKEPSSAPSKRTGFLENDEPAFVQWGEELAKHDKIFAEWWDRRPATYSKKRG